MLRGVRCVQSSGLGGKQGQKLGSYVLNCPRYPQPGRARSFVTRLDWVNTWLQSLLHGCFFGKGSAQHGMLEHRVVLPSASATVLPGGLGHGPAATSAPGG